MATIDHFFVLMLENRSFDNIFGFSHLQGIDPRTGKPVKAEDLEGGHFQVRMPNGKSIPITGNAKFRLRRVGDKQGPAHEFTDILLDICGPSAFSPDTIAENVKTDEYKCEGGNYPPFVSDADNLAYALDYRYHGGKKAKDVVSCFSPDQLPVLNQLAREYVVCDHWFSSMPGPTWPNRFFGMCGSSGGLDHSQSLAESIESGVHINGFKFEFGSIFERLGDNWLVVHGGCSQAAAIAGIEYDLDHFIELDNFMVRLTSGTITEKFIWIEPRYDVFFHYELGDSMHPHGDVRNGERLVKKVYEEIRQSKYWKSSILLVVFDENGGFYDHVIPPEPSENLVPGDRTSDGSYNKHNFRFDALGPRVPAIIVSPWVVRGGIDQTEYDHTAIIKTAADLFGFDPKLGGRVEHSASFKNVLNVSSPRLSMEEAPIKLETPKGHPIVWWRLLWGAIVSWLGPKTVTTTEAPFAAAAIRMHTCTSHSSTDGISDISEKEAHAYLKKEIGVFKARNRKAKF